MKRIKKYLVLLILLLSSFYLTNSFILTMRDHDEIMKEIDKNSKKYKIESINAKVTEKTIIPGVKGQEVDREKSYHKMKQYGKYNEAMTVMKEVTPEISMSSYYDKYIEKGNNQKRRIGLIFPIKEANQLKSIIPILEKENVNATFFIDGNCLDDIISYLKKYQKYEYELLSFKGEYNPYYLNTAESYLKNITKKEVKYCYTEKDNKDILKYCSNKKYHTIKPSMILKDNLTYQVKKKLENGLIISININDNSKKELLTMIEYIKGKGFEFSIVNEIIKE